jgi:hypothetical protein
VVEQQGDDCSGSDRSGLERRVAGLGARQRVRSRDLAQPRSGLGPPLLVLLSPTLFVLAREWAGRRAVLVTDDAIIDVDHEGASQRIGLSAIYRVRRDWLRGGVRLEGPDGRVRIPPILLDDARRAVASRRRGRVRGSTQVDDSTGFWP